MLLFFNQNIFRYVFGLSLLFFCIELEAKKENQDFVIFTPPKCGTHLVAKAVQLIVKKEPLYCLTQLGTLEEELRQIQTAKEQNQFVVAHDFSPELIKILAKKGYKIIFILRDPRDQLISLINFMKKGNWQEYPVAHIENQKEQIDELITGTLFNFRAFEGCIKSRLERVLPLPSRLVYVTRFEHLVGPKGGGSEKLQEKEILKIAHFLNCKISKDEAKQIGDEMFGGTWSFHDGQIGKWRSHFLPSQKEMYKILYGETLKQLGYTEF